jgi:hypothetical protein
VFVPVGRFRGPRRGPSRWDAVRGHFRPIGSHKGAVFRKYSASRSLYSSQFLSSSWYLSKCRWIHLIAKPVRASTNCNCLTCFTLTYIRESSGLTIFQKFHCIVSYRKDSMTSLEISIRRKQSIVRRLCGQCTVKQRPRGMKQDITCDILVRRSKHFITLMPHY